VIAYSLGNFVFGSYSRRVSESALLRLRGRDAAVTEVAVLPLNVFNPEVVFHPRPLTGSAARRVARFLLGPDARPAGDGWWRRPATVTAPVEAERRFSLY
jgi:hypothetical protein